MMKIFLITHRLLIDCCLRILLLGVDMISFIFNLIECLYSGNAFVPVVIFGRNNWSSLVFKLKRL